MPPCFSSVMLEAQLRLVADAERFCPPQLPRDFFDFWEGRPSEAEAEALCGLASLAAAVPSPALLKLTPCELLLLQCGAGAANLCGSCCRSWWCGLSASGKDAPTLRTLRACEQTSCSARLPCVGQAAVGFLGHFGGAIGWACEMPTLVVSMLTLVLALERQDPAGLVACRLKTFAAVPVKEQVEKYILGAARIVGGQPPAKARLRAQRLWLVIPILVMLLPETLIRRCCAANALITAELGFVLANCARQLSFGEYYAARTRRVHSRTDAWAQVATACSRSLPLTSALALTNTLISTTLGAVNVSFGGIFPIFGLAVCVRAIQKAVESQASAVLTRQEGQDAQKLGKTFPPYSIVETKDTLPFWSALACELEST